MTHSAALVGMTDRIALFATAQTSILHPTWTARAIATIDHASDGRAGLNIVCGWNEFDFAMFGVEDVGAHRRYDQGEEWTTIFSRQVRGERPESVHYDGSAQPLADVWLALRVSMRHVIEHVSLDELVNGPLPPNVTELIDNPDAWVSG